MDRASRDQNYVTTIMGVSLSDNETPVNVHVDPSTHRMLVSAIITGGSPTGTEYTEGDTDASFSGFMMLAEGTGNTATPVQINDQGELKVSASVSASITFFADGLNFIAGTSEGIPVMGVYESSPTNVTDGDLAIAGLTIDRRLKTSAAVTSSALPTGAATAANQTTIIGHVDGIEALLTTIDADTGNMVTALQLIDNAAATIGSTDVLRVAIFDGSDNQITSFGGGVEYSDGDANADPTGKVAMGTDGSNVFALHTDTSGDLQVDVLSSALPSGAATSAKQDTIIGHVDGIETLLTTLAGAVSGTEMQVDVITMPTVTVQATNLDIRDIDQASDAIRIYANTAKDGSGTAYIPLVDTDGHLQVDVLTSGLPSGAATSANQTTIIGHVDGIEGLLTTIDADTGSISTNMATVAGAVSGTEMQVDVVAPLPAGTNNIGDVDVLSSALPTGASTAANQTTIIGHVDGIEGLLTTIDTDTGNMVTSLQLIDDAVYTDDGTFTPGTSKLIAVGYQADETSTDSVDEGDIGTPRMTLDRKQIVTLSPSATTAGWDTANMTSGDTFTALTNSAQAVKASAGKFGGYYIYNPNASVMYVMVYNVAHGSVTVGTTTAKLIFAIPASSAANLEISNGITFDTAIAVAAATTAGGNSAPGTALEANFWYK